VLGQRYRKYGHGIGVVGREEREEWMKGDEGACMTYFESLSGVTLFLCQRTVALLQLRLHLKYDTGWLETKWVGKMGRTGWMDSETHFLSVSRSFWA
jgi:hypothetical protein